MTSRPNVVPDDASFDLQRRQMVDRQIRRRGITDRRICDAFLSIPRHAFVPAGSEAYAYEDRPLPIGEGQTISQPYIVALIASLAAPAPTSRILDIGTGCGYQAAILSRLCQQVFTIELIPSLASAAAERLRRLGLHNITARQGDGYQGWPDAAPFDAIVVAAASPAVPPALVDQLASGGRLVIPVGDESQQLLLIEKQSDGSTRTLATTPVSFVPLVPGTP